MARYTIEVHSHIPPADHFEMDRALPERYPQTLSSCVQGNTDTEQHQWQSPRHPDKLHWESLSRINNQEQ